MSHFVVGGHKLFTLTHHMTLALWTKHHLFNRTDKVKLPDGLACFTRCKNSRLVHQRVELGS